MVEPAQLGVYEFDDFRLDVVERTLWKGEERLELGGRAFEVLAALVRRAGKLVTKEELFRVAWHGRVVEEGNLHVQISALRKVLGPKAITTVARYGYRLELSEPRPPASLHSESAYIPAPLGPLIGRSDEVATIASLLVRHRLITIKGMGGIGKTRLALAVASSKESFAERTRRLFVSLSSIDAGQDVESYLMHASFASGRVFKGDFSSYATALREEPTLLVVDGCDLVTEAVAKASRRLLEACPELVLLCTSRRSLGLLEEHIYDCPPMHSSDAQELLAARLGLGQQANLIPPGQRSGAMERILPRLEGIPLAIEIAAALIKRVGSAEFEEQLLDRMNSIAGPDPSLPERQRTLEATIEWSYRLLNPDEQRFLNRMAILQSGFGALEGELIGLVPSQLQADAINLISALIDKSFIVRELRDSNYKYKIPESIRTYALSLPGFSPERESALRARGKWALKLVKENYRLRGLGNWSGYLSDLEYKYPDLRSAFSYSTIFSSWEEAAELAYGLFYFWIDTARLKEGLQTTLDLLEKAPPIKSIYYYQLLHAAGGLTQDLGDHTRSDQFLSAAIAGFRGTQSDPAQVALALNDWGVTKHYLGWHAEAADIYAEALALSAHLKMTRHEIQVRSNLAVLHCYQDRFALAEGILVEAIALHEHVNDAKGRALCKSWLGECRAEQSDYAGYLQVATEALALYNGLPEDLIMGVLLHRLACALAVNGSASEASRHWRAAETITTSFSNERATVELLESAALIFEKIEDWGLAIKLNKFLTSTCAGRQGLMTPVRQRRLSERDSRLKKIVGAEVYDLQSFSASATEFNTVVAVLRQRFARI